MPAHAPGCLSKKKQSGRMAGAMWSMFSTETAQAMQLPCQVWSTSLVYNGFKTASPLPSV
ncbi:MAG: hypothetical protein IAE86_15050 [Burkholderiaceae bacterium]|nr:hypothetical protein [Burkholderiaceae bacterium]